MIDPRVYNVCEGQKGEIDLNIDLHVFEVLNVEICMIIEIVPIEVETREDVDDHDDRKMRRKTRGLCILYIFRRPPRNDSARCARLRVTVARKPV